MHKKKTKKHKTKRLIIAISTIALLTNCTTTKHRDQQLIKTLNLQNETIQTLIVKRGNQISKNKSNLIEVNKENELELLKTLNAVKESNIVVISKLKPKQVKECNCGQNERTND